MRVKIDFMAASLLVFFVSQASIAAPPSPGDGLLPGGELNRSEDRYPEQKKQFWGDDALSRAFKQATDRTDDFLSQMWAHYGPKVANEAGWQTSLRNAVQAAKSGNWKQADLQSRLCVEQNPNAEDAKFLRVLAVNKLGRLEKFDSKTLAENRQNARDLIQGKAKVGPVANAVLRQLTEK